MTTIPTIYQLTHQGTAPLFNAAFAKGVEKIEGRPAPIVTDGKLRPGPVALWGEHQFHKTLKTVADEGRTWYYGDHAYFGRHKFFRVTKNALQVTGGYFDGGFEFEQNMERLAQVRKVTPVEVQPIKPMGDFVLVCPPSAALAERSGFVAEQWTKVICNRLTKTTKRKVVIRQKPRINRTAAPLLEALHGAYMLVTYSSNAAIEAVMAGYPAICTGPNPVNVFSNTFEKFSRPFVANVDARTAWAAMLCANQWTLAEIEAGKAWERMNP